MIKTEFEARNFIEGSQTPLEEPSYWKFLRGESVSLNRVQEEGQLFRLAIDRLILGGEAKLISEDLCALVPGG